MALSNWDTFAVSTEPCREGGVFPLGRGLSAEVYKNWVYLRREGQEDVLGSVNEAGNLHLGDASLVVRRADEGTTALIVARRGYGEDEAGFAAIGCYGFEGEDWVGVQPHQIQALTALIRSAEVSFSPACMAALLAAIGTGSRFNQGDAFFARALGGDAADVATPPGEADKPAALKMLGG